MKTFTKSLSGLLSASVLAIGLAVIAQPAVAGIASSKHDMSTVAGAGTTEVCVFCHTPHGSNTDVQAPLWNKALPVGGAAQYTAYSSSTMDAPASVGSVSLACLSCHDGAQARSNMINIPGSGGYVAPGAGGSGGGTAGGMSNMNTAFGATNILVLGTDLSNDHPVGMRYCGAASVAAALAGTCLDDSFFNAASAVTAAKVSGTTGTRLWVEIGGNTTFSKTDLPLYGDGAPGINVECATCHDPHTNNAIFLRKVNTASGLCLTCHNK